MECKHCNKKIDDMKLSEQITVVDKWGNTINPSVLNCNYTEAIETIIKTGYRNIVKIFQITVKNYKQFSDFLNKEIEYVQIEGETYERFSIEQISEKEFKITVK